MAWLWSNLQTLNTWRGTIVLVGAFAWSGTVAAEPELETAAVDRHTSAQVGRPGRDLMVLTANPYVTLSNEQLAGIADRWNTLNLEERRWFFVEVRRRLVAPGNAKANTNADTERSDLPLRSNARFGQPERDRDGSALGAEARPVQGESPSRPLAVDNDSRAYGLGFERRLEVQGRLPVQSEPIPAAARLPAGGRRRPSSSGDGT